jgi:mutator protein MutT
MRKADAGLTDLGVRRLHIPSAEPPLREVADAIIITETNRYLMKRRDDLPWLIFPDQWSFFGGGLEPGETPEQALRRELIEELAFRAGEVEFFTDWRVTLPFPTPRVEHVHFFAVPIAAAEIANFVLSEGAEMRLFLAEELAATVNVVPLDLAAVLLHARRHQLFRPLASFPGT